MPRPTFSRLFLPLLVLLLWPALSIPAFSAQEGQRTPGQNLLENERDDLSARQELAARMHAIHPAREQIDAAIEQAAQSGVPPEEQQAFILSMKRIIDYRALENASIEAMAESFTYPELKAMVEYYEKPEAQSASEKFPAYQKKIEPMVYRMLDRAMMQVRTGSAPGSLK